MKWFIPAKTFLLGEYAALAGHPAFILTTSPSFELTLVGQPGLHGIHPDSPAGKWWLKHGDPNQGLLWEDPYDSQGGLGASSAQFLGAYLATPAASELSLLEAYRTCAWNGQGMVPSGYDVIAQSIGGCVYIAANCGERYPWFEDLAFILVRTHHKLATHHHLQKLNLSHQLNGLAEIVATAKRSFELNESTGLIDAVNQYNQALSAQNLVAESTLAMMAELKQQKDILAMKGCGAMGADLLLILLSNEKLTELKATLTQQGLTIVATHADLYM